MTNAIYVNLEKCDGCDDCMQACKKTHNGISHIKVMEIGKRYIPISCHHCETPLCLASCEKEAMEKTEEGAVVISPEKCTGCKNCIIACPYGAITFDSNNKKATKCDLCIGEEIPVCVTSCKPRALTFGEINSLIWQVRKKIAEDMMKGEKALPTYYFMTTVQPVGRKK
jgi:carbon-monoxide dehydrogenase iron sulfur subunit